MKFNRDLPGIIIEWSGAVVFSIVALVMVVMVVCFIVQAFTGEPQ